MKNYKVVIEYDGTFYNGLQKQKSNSNTIYSAIYNALFTVLKGSIVELNFCGRTDAGVHAFGQVLNIKTNCPFVFPSGKLALGMNFYLRGEQISAISSIEVDNNFHARYSCVQRVYKYIILNRSFKSPLYKNRVWLVPYKMNLDKFKEVCNVFVGTFDFSSFRNQDCTAKSPIRTIDFINIEINKDMIEITIASKSFLYNMVRNIVGAIVDTSRGKICLEEIKKQLIDPNKSTLDRFQIAPSCGLYFMQAKYS